MRSLEPRWLVLSLLAALGACAPQSPPQKPWGGKLQVPTATVAPAAPSNLKFTADYAGHVCQVGSTSCLSLDSRPFAPCLVAERCDPEGEVIRAAKP